LKDSKLVNVKRHNKKNTKLFNVEDHLSTIFLDLNVCDDRN
jgi:hypothetical protein